MNNSKISDLQQASERCWCVWRCGTCFREILLSAAFISMCLCAIIPRQKRKLFFQCCLNELRSAAPRVSSDAESVSVSVASDSRLHAALLPALRAWNFNGGLERSWRTRQSTAGGCRHVSVYCSSKNLQFFL